MADERHKLQKDPPEGSREAVERELERNEAEGAPTDKRRGGKPHESSRDG